MTSKQGLFIQSAARITWPIVQMVAPALCVFPAYLWLIYQENELVYAKADINTLKNEVYEHLGYAAV